MAMRKIGKPKMAKAPSIPKKKVGRPAMPKGLMAALAGAGGPPPGAGLPPGAGMGPPPGAGPPMMKRGGKVKAKAKKKR